MKYCTKCGNQLNDNAIFCTKCGINLINGSTNSNNTIQNINNISCPKCHSNNINFQVINESTLVTKHHGILWWLLIGWWWIFVKWIFLTIPALIFAIFVGKRKKIKNTTKNWNHFCEFSKIIKMFFLSDFNIIRLIYNSQITDTSRIEIYPIDILSSLDIVNTAMKSIMTSSNANSRSDKYVNLISIGKKFYESVINS